jgi:glucose-6-phosphate isomerase
VSTTYEALSGHFEGEVCKAQDFIIVPYTIPLRCAAAYYPETNEESTGKVL